MINQRIGDILEIQYEGLWSYGVVLTRTVMFGGNIIYAFHGDGTRIAGFEASPDRSGFNVITDLLMPKKHGTVTRLGKAPVIEPYFKTKYVKGCHEHRPGFKALEWWIYKIDDWRSPIARVSTLSEQYRNAMDDGMSSYDLVVKKILAGYEPKDNPFI